MADQPKGPATDPAAPPGAPQIQIDVDETTAQGAYSNLVLINHNENEFVLDFAYIQPSAPRARVRARIISSPRHTKRLLRALEHNVRRYEERFGRIEEPEPMPIPPMPSGGLISRRSGHTIFTTAPRSFHARAIGSRGGPLFMGW